MIGTGETVDINATLFGQMLTFALLVWFTMKYVWPPILQALEIRQQKIAAGLHAAEQSKLELAQTKIQVEEQLMACKKRVDGLLKEAEKGAEDILHQAKQEADKEYHRTIAAAQDDIKQQLQQEKTVLFSQVVDIVIKATEHILQKSVGPETDLVLLNQFIRDQH